MLIVLAFFVGIIVGWELRNFIAAFIRQAKEYHKEEKRRQKLRQNQTWAQIKRVGPKPKEVICK